MSTSSSRLPYSRTSGAPTVKPEPVLSQTLTNFAYMGGFFLIPQVLGSRGLGFSESTTGYLVIARPLAFSLIARSIACIENVPSG